MPSQRQLRVGEQLKHIIAETLQRGHFGHEDLLDCGHITVTEVRASPDLRNATAYIVVYNDDDINPVIKALNAESSVFQKDIGSQSNMKFTPRISFKEDYSFAQAGRIEDVLKDITYPTDED